MFWKNTFHGLHELKLKIKSNTDKIIPLTYSFFSFFHSELFEMKKDYEALASEVSKVMLQTKSSVTLI